MSRPVNEGNKTLPQIPLSCPSKDEENLPGARDEEQKRTCNCAFLCTFHCSDCLFSPEGNWGRFPLGKQAATESFMLTSLITPNTIARGVSGQLLAVDKTEQI